MPVNQLSKREIKRYLGVLSSYGFPVENLGKVYRGFEVVLKRGSLIYLDSRPCLVCIENRILPFIEVARECMLKEVYVDRGAVKPITNGADVMIPGIVKYDEFNVGDVVVIKLVDTGSFLAIGLALINSVDIKAMKKGKAIKNMHYLGDEFWLDANDRRKKR